MSQPSTCPFCSADRRRTDAEEYKCGTIIPVGAPKGYKVESIQCLHRQRDGLLARVAELERQLSDFRADGKVTASPVARERHPLPGKVGDDVNSQGHPAEAVRYRFRTFQELMDRVPTARMADCFYEMGVWFRLAKAGIEAVAATHKQKNPEFIIPDSLLEVPEEIEWIDDGKGQIQATLLHQDGSVRLVAKSGPKNTP